ncbi:unnamed protein product [Heterobilharzia americana]|nr:unnamed protein product [Heterobilharzia americana]
MDSYIQTINTVKYIISWILIAWTLITMMTLVIQAGLFRRCWLKHETYNNVYITRAFIEQEKEALQRD